MKRQLQLCVAVTLMTATLIPLSATPAPTLTIINKPIERGFKKGRVRTVDTIVIHSVFAPSRRLYFGVQGVIHLFRHYGVSAHYLIDREGKVYRLVDESNVSYHAGVSAMPDGRTNVSEFSIGIELIGSRTSGFTDAQYRSLNLLISDIKQRHSIENVVLHKEVAPKRKTDPWMFERSRLIE